jgi:hypothetical protein
MKYICGFWFVMFAMVAIILTVKNNPNSEFAFLWAGLFLAFSKISSLKEKIKKEIK